MLGPPGLPRETGAAHVAPWDEALDGPEPVEPSDAELLGVWPDPFAGSPDGADAWLADLSLPELDALARRWAKENGSGIPGPIGAGFTHRADGGETIIPGAVGFEAGGVLDVMEPDAVLAGFVGDTSEAGLGALSDDELIGLLCAARRLSSWQAAVEYQAVTELDHRRRRGSDISSSRTAAHIEAEIGAALTLTGRSAGSLLGLSRDLARLPMVLTALSAGIIDQAKAKVFATELAALGDVHACAIAAALWRPARRMTTSTLRAEIRALVIKLDPGALRRRRERARDDARVEIWQEGSGNQGIAGRELPTAEVVTADKRLTAIAHELKQAGAVGTIDQLRAAVFTALLTGRDPSTLAPHQQKDQRPLASITGTVHLTMPLSAWAGWTDAPGEVAGFGPVDAETGRDLAERLVASDRARWCVTFTDHDDKAAGHACTKSAPGKDPPDIVTWLESLTIDWLERGTCSHRRKAESYRPGRKLGHLVEIRQRTCSFPGCRRPAETCDLDHTVPYDDGGITCECNLGAACRQHHQTKQAPGWRLAQTEPGYFTWTAPHGRSYSVGPDSYPVLPAPTEDAQEKEEHVQDVQEDRRRE